MGTARLYVHNTSTITPSVENYDNQPHVPEEFDVEFAVDDQEWGGRKGPRLTSSQLPPSHLTRSGHWSKSAAYQTKPVIYGLTATTRLTEPSFRLGYREASCKHHADHSSTSRAARPQQQLQQHQIPTTTAAQTRL